MFKNIVSLLCLFVIILVFVVILFNRDADQFIPKTIYTYWHDHDNIPEIVRRCVDTWKQHNPDHQVIMLNIDKVKELCGVDLSTLNIPAEFSARYADFARLIVIAKYGGIWLDSTIICTRPLDWIHDIYKKSKAEIITYKSPQTTSATTPVIENWFFAAPPNSIFITDWLEEANRTRQFPSEEEYVTHIKTKTDVDIQGIDFMLPYLIMHLCTLVIQHRNKNKYNIYAMDSTTGPFKYLADNEWNSSQAVEALCRNKDLISDIIKLRGGERTFIENNKITCEKDSVDPSIYYVVKHD